MSEKTTQYLLSVLRLNPLENADEIIQRREIAIGLQKPTRKAAPTPTQAPQSEIERRSSRERVKSRINNLRSKFWVLNPNQLRSQLDAIPLKNYPELRGTVDRLKLMTVYKAAFEQIGHFKNKSTNFWNTFKRIVIATPQKAGQIKEEYIRSLGQQGDVKRVQATLKKIRSKFPEVYQLEAEWFDQIRKLKPRKLNDDETEISLETPGWLKWILWISILTFIRFLIAVSN